MALQAAITLLQPSMRKAGLASQLLRFGAVGVVGFVVNAALVELSAPTAGPLWAQLLAFPVAASVTWWLNRRYTFGASGRTMLQEWLRYVVANLLGWAANNGTYVWLVWHFPLAYQHPSIAVAAGSIAGMCFNFVVSKRVVFSQSADNP
jgi:putative flippase GtrA